LENSKGEILGRQTRRIRGEKSWGDKQGEFERRNLWEINKNEN